MATPIAAPPVLLTVAPDETVSGEALVLTRIPLLSVPEHVTAVFACAGSGVHWAKAKEGQATAKARVLTVMPRYAALPRKFPIDIFLQKPPFCGKTAT
jgi:hypothetical protein